MSHWDPDLYTRGNFIHAPPQLHFLVRYARFRILQQHALTKMQLDNRLDALVALQSLGLDIIRGFRVDYLSLLGVNLFNYTTTWSRTSLREYPSTRHRSQ